MKKNSTANKQATIVINHKQQLLLITRDRQG
jgi:hypothetical protein